MRVFLIYVRDPHFFNLLDGKRSADGKIRVMAFPPLGVMSLSAVLKRAGHECVLFDQANPETPDALIAGEVRRQKPDLVGLSFLSSTSYPYAKILARRIRAEAPKARIAMGGLFASVNAERVKMQCPEVDYVCRGDGEQLILDLLERLDDPDTVAGVTWAEKRGRMRHNPDRPFETNLDQWPFPDREGIPLDYVESMPLDVPAVLSLDRFTTMQTSRGCPFSCIFCDIPPFCGRRWRPRSAAHVLAELRHLQERGYRSTYFVDDHFLLQPRRVEEICSGIVEQRIGIRWGCEGRADAAGRKLFPAMARARCRALMFGIESGSPTVLERLGKRQKPEEVAATVAAAKNAGIEIVHGFFIVGAPDETEKDMRQTFRFAERLRIDSFAFNRLCVYRGTPLWKEYVQRGLVDDDADWYKYIKCSSVDPSVLSGEEIHRIRSEEMRKLIVYKFTRRPLQTFRLLRLFLRHMSLRNVIYLLIKPFLGKKGGTTNAEDVSRAVEQVNH